VITDLLFASSAIDLGTVARAVPPACRRPPSPVSSVVQRDTELLLELPEWKPRVAARHLVPSLSVLTEARYAVRFELSAWMDGAWSPWVGTATVGSGVFAPLPASASGLACDIDVYTTAVPCERFKLRIRVGASDARGLASAPWLAALSVSDLAPRAGDDVAAVTPRLAVPALSQLDAPADIASRICSPTSVAMVLEYWGAPSPLLAIAQELFHAETDRYGVWPAAIVAAGRRGVAGYLLRFPDWASAAWCFEQALPIIASVRYADGELTDAALAETTGHLIVLTGCDADHVFVNDPVAPLATVQRRYRIDEIKRAWLDRTGVGYVLFSLGGGLRPPSDAARA
jgi:hypothetical protein